MCLRVGRLWLWCRARYAGTPCPWEPSLAFMLNTVGWSMEGSSRESRLKPGPVGLEVEAHRMRKGARVNVPQPETWRPYMTNPYNPRLEIEIT